MKRFTVAAVVGLTAPAAAVATGPAGAVAAAPAGLHAIHVCAKAPAGYAACMSQLMVAANGKAVAIATPSGYGPADIQSAYNLPSSGGATVAIVDAFDDPNAAPDLNTYRSTYGLPPCTSGNGCFTKVNQRGGATPPAADAAWALEISLDLDMVSAACPGCHILLVEADSNSFADLATAVNYAATQDVVAISNSYGGSDQRQLAAYNHKGIAITASSGDNGYGVSSPASFRTVIGVGGTSLHPAANARGWRETAWSGAGSGCSTLNSKPAWQTSATHCAGKAIADVSAVADPSTGVAVYDTYQEPGWLIVGGTSASSPIIASVYARGGHLANYPAAYTWGHTSHLYDVKSGSNGGCPTSVWCHAGAGWDGPTGLGTPRGLAAF
jgi:subtilase family serine protease